MEPALCLGPVATNRARRNAEDLGCLVFGESSEEATLDHTAQPLIDFRQGDECFVQGEQKVSALFDDERRIREAYLSGSVSALVRTVASCVIHEDPAHGLGRDSKEMRPVHPLHASLVDELEVCLMNQRARVERVPVPLAPELPVRDSPQLLVDKGEKLVGCVSFPCAPCEQEAGDGLVLEFDHTAKITFGFGAAIAEGANRRR